ncbi:unnamed protein product [Trifolium pratense]|uniref:Uncharacterized protein n=1 Tax=Trifolium pratense TaxID=57577 RepID=A0ACB0JR76_TRIPR|nr:unnamed protein product [Trifolium pratense]
MAAEPVSEEIPTGTSAAAITNLPSTAKESTKSGLTHSLTIKLDEKNFLLWSQQVNGVITAHNLHRFVVNPEIPLQYSSVTDRLDGKNSEEYQKWLFKDQTLFTWLLSTISDGVLPRVLNCKHAHEVWESIHKYFNSVLKSRARQLRPELKNTKKLSRSVNEYILRIKTIVNSLIVVGDIVSEREQVDAILEGLPEEFNPFVMMVYSRFETPVVEEVEALLLLQEAQFEKFRQELANPSVSTNIAQMDTKSNSSNSNSDSNDFGTEHYNVTATRGRGRGKGRGRGRGRAPSAPNTGKVQCQICSKSNHDALNCWHRDASFKTESVPSSTLHQHSSPMSSQFSVLNKDGYCNSALSTASPMSSQFPASNKDGHCNNTLSKASPISSQFSVLSNNIHCNNALSTGHLDNEFHKWHLRLGHAHNKAVQTVLNWCNVPYSNKNIVTSCTFCCIGKSHRLYAPLSKTNYTTPFEVIHCDLWGPAPFESYYGYNYYITFVDTYTKYTWIYFLKQKSDALKAFTQFLTFVQNQFQASVKALQSDWGGEFRPFTILLNSLGIQHRLTCPHTSHQNGTVERKHRQIVEMGLTMLSQSSIPLKFWDHSFTQAVYLINKLPSSALPSFKSPHLALFKSQPDYTLLKVFGCLCFPHLRPYNKNKLQFRSSPCVYLGVSPQHKGHKCLDEHGRIYVSKDVIFHESQFPYPTMFSISSSQNSSENQPEQNNQPLYTSKPDTFTPLNITEQTPTLTISQINSQISQPIKSPAENTKSKDQPYKMQTIQFHQNICNDK